MLFQIGKENAAAREAKNVDFAAPADGAEPALFNEGPVLIEIKALRAVLQKGGFGLPAPSSVAIRKEKFHLIVGQGRGPPEGEFDEPQTARLFVKVGLYIKIVGCV